MERGENKDITLNNLLIEFRSTPRVVTRQPPGDLIFRVGYQQAFPHKIGKSGSISE